MRWSCAPARTPSRPSEEHRMDTPAHPPPQSEKTSMDTPAESATQVVIVGGGPVGLGLAIDLGQRGVSCVLVDRNTSPQPIPKGQNLTQRTLEHFYFWGAEPALRAARTIPPDYGIGGQ